MPNCTLCDLPTPDPPVTEADVDGVYCCRGCLAVARTLDDVASADPERVRADLRSETTDAGTNAELPDDERETTYYAVEGMHCTTCEAFLESRARTVPGVIDADANYAGDAMRVSYAPAETDPDALPTRLSAYGYTVHERGSESASENGDLTRGSRLLLGGFFGMMVMVWYVLFLYPVYLGRGALLPFFDVTGVAGRYLLWNVAVLAGAAMAITGYPVFRGALVSLRARQPNMDLLVALAASAAYVYSLAILGLGGSEVYFDVAFVVVFAVSLGGYWESRVKRRAASGVESVATERTDTARVRTESGVEERGVDALEADDRVVVGSGERVPVDGTVVDGDGAVDESLLSGESLPRDVDTGDSVAGGAVLVSGGVTVRVSAPVESTYDRITAALWDAQSTHGGVQRLADTAAAVFVPVVLALAVCGFVAHLLLGATLASSLLTGLTVLVVSCPCALGLATPLAASRGIREAIDRGAFVTNSAAFERGRDIETVAFDKTGTLTTGEMCIESVVGDADALEAAAALETYADHPVAAAVCAYANVGEMAVSSVQQHTTGVSGVVDGTRVRVGRPDLFETDEWSLPDSLRERALEGLTDGYVPIVVGLDGVGRAVAFAGDTPRDGWTAVVDRLGRDHRVVVLTGDDDARTQPFRGHDGVDEVFAGVPPEGKTAVVNRLRADGPVAMVGDGTNDAPALAAADLGIAFGARGALTADAADVVATVDDLAVVPDFFDITSATRSRIRTNLAWAFGYNAVAVPLALLGVLNPLVAAVAMALSSLVVVTNSTRRLVETGSRRVEANPFERLKTTVAAVVGR